MYVVKNYNSVCHKDDFPLIITAILRWVLYGGGEQLVIFQEQLLVNDYSYVPKTNDMRNPLFPAVCFGGN